MDIIVFCDKDGKNSINKGFFNNEFMLIEVCTIDEDEINHIIKRSVDSGFKLTKVNVLDDDEYKELKNKAKKWDEYSEWKKAKEVYEKNKEKY